MSERYRCDAAVWGCAVLTGITCAVVLPHTPLTTDPHFSQPPPAPPEPCTAAHIPARSSHGRPAYVLRIAGRAGARRDDDAVDRARMHHRLNLLQRNLIIVVYKGYLCGAQTALQVSATWVREQDVAALRPCSGTMKPVIIYVHACRHQIASPAASSTCGWRRTSIYFGNHLEQVIGV